MSRFIDEVVPVAAVIGIALSLVVVVPHFIELPSVARKQRIIELEFQLQAVRAGLGEFYVSTNTATIEFRLKPTP
jgi:Na+/alanine symporter